MNSCVLANPFLMTSKLYDSPMIYTKDIGFESHLTCTCIKLTYVCDRLAVAARTCARGARTLALAARRRAGRCHRAAHLVPRRQRTRRHSINARQ